MMHVLLDWYAVIFIFEVLRPSDECGVEDTVFAALAGFLIHYLYLNIKMAMYFIEHYGRFVIWVSLGVGGDETW